jgi:hypothetical protein
LGKNSAGRRKGVFSGADFGRLMEWLSDFLPVGEWRKTGNYSRALIYMSNPGKAGLFLRLGEVVFGGWFGGAAHDFLAGLGRRKGVFCEAELGRSKGARAAADFWCVASFCARAFLREVWQRGVRGLLKYLGKVLKIREKNNMEVLNTHTHTHSSPANLLDSRRRFLDRGY